MMATNSLDSGLDELVTEPRWRGRNRHQDGAQHVLDLDDDQLRQYLRDAKLAIAMIATGLDSTEAKAVLDDADGMLGRVISRANREEPA